MKTGSSYCSQSELPVTIGLGHAPRASGLRITWPNGRVEEIPAVEANRTVIIQEGKGVIRQTPFRSAS